ncbi:MAG: hypothetical protein KDB22_29700, partial [Planctomycetales bacterium]|nr:hypothetical protein [Planctomycetales bacterium]
RQPLIGIAELPSLDSWVDRVGRASIDHLRLIVGGSGHDDPQKCISELGLRSGLTNIAGKIPTSFIGILNNVYQSKNTLWATFGNEN